jgi:NADP-reducing hydrogenase subunit HndC
MFPSSINKGAQWFASIGTEKSKGTKVFALAGKINNVGLIEVPMGTTLRDVIFEIGGGIKDGKKFKAVQTGGPSGGCLTEKHLDTPIDYRQPDRGRLHDGLRRYDCNGRRRLHGVVAKFYLDFTVEESCGKCSPAVLATSVFTKCLKPLPKAKALWKPLKSCEPQPCDP